MMVWLVGKCGCHDRSFSGILGPRLFLSPDNRFVGGHGLLCLSSLGVVRVLCRACEKLGRGCEISQQSVPKATVYSTGRYCLAEYRYDTLKSPPTRYLRPPDSTAKGQYIAITTQIAWAP